MGLFQLAKQCCLSRELSRITSLPTPLIIVLFSDDVVVRANHSTAENPCFIIVYIRSALLVLRTIIRQ